MNRVPIAVAATLAVGLLSSCSSSSAGPSIPSSSRLSKPTSIDYRNVLLTPPPRGTKPAVTASEAWHSVKKWPRAGSYRLVLADWHPGGSALMFGTTDFSGGLVWAIEGSHVKVPCSWGSGPLPISHRSCRSVYESAISFVNAKTGQASTEVMVYPTGT